MSSNNIPVTQNAEPQIRLLRARRQMYARGTRFLAIQLLLTVGVPIIGSLLTLPWPDLKEAVALSSLVIAILDVAVLDHLQKRIRISAAKAQEQFDCVTLEMPWDEFTVRRTLTPLFNDCRHSVTC